jgi:hypothetical protein
MFHAAFFRDRHGTALRQEKVSMASLAERIARERGHSKQALPLFNLCRFGAKRSKKGSLRWDGNVLAIGGVLGDYDGEQVGFDAAVDALLRCDIAGIVYTSPSHTIEKPRWRVVCPFLGRAYPGADHARFVSRLNGLVGGVLARESWTLSQGYYYGRVPDKSFRVEMTDGDGLDLADHLDAGAVGKPLASPPENARACGVPARTTELSAYGAAALRSAAEKIEAAVRGSRYFTLNNESFSIGRAVGAGIIPEDVALVVLCLAVDNMLHIDGHEKAGAEEIVKKALADGVGRPRSVADDAEDEEYGDVF